MSGDNLRNEMNYISRVWEMYYNSQISSATLKYCLMPTSVAQCVLPESDTKRREREQQEKWDRYDELRTKELKGSLTGDEYFELLDLKKEVMILDQAALDYQLIELEKLAAAHQKTLQSMDDFITGMEQILEEPRQQANS